jgi:peptidoglycan/LPS O-acetylase OafA/YrhL
MKRLAIVAAACALMVVFALLHKNALSLTIGIVVGTPYFLWAMGKGGGIAQARITRDPGEPVKPRDPSGSVGMGLAAAGIGAAAMADDNFPEPARIFYGVCFVLGMVIALVFAAKKNPPADSL